LSRSAKACAYRSRKGGSKAVAAARPDLVIQLCVYPKRVGNHLVGLDSSAAGVMAFVSRSTDKRSRSRSWSTRLGIFFSAPDIFHMQPRRRACWAWGM